MRDDTYARMCNRIGGRLAQGRVPFWQINAHEARTTKLKGRPRFDPETLISSDFDTHDGHGTT